MKEADVWKGMPCTHSGTLYTCNAAAKGSQPNHTYWFLFMLFFQWLLHHLPVPCLLLMILQTRVRQNSKQREEELELIEQLRKVRADKTSEPLSKCLVCHRVKAALVFWTDCTEPIMVRSWPELNGTVQSECFFQMDADWAAVKYTALTPACDWPVIFAFRMNACIPPYHPSYLWGAPWEAPSMPSFWSPFKNTSLL